MKPSTPNGARGRSSDDPRLTVSQSRRFSRAMDRTFRAQGRSDPVSVMVYSLILMITYTLMAQAIIRYELSFGYILLPWIVEYLLMLWIGVLLTRTWVKEPIFAAISGSVIIALVWTTVLLTPYAIAFGWQALFGLDPEAGRVSAVWARLVDSGMAWACVAVTVGLLVDTVRDVTAWRSSRGPFVWPATHRFAFRLAAMLAVCMATPFVLWALFAVHTLVGSEMMAAEFKLSWLMFGMFVAADGLALVVGIWVHRREVRKGHRAEKNEAET
ncbi:MAG: hypothetical protein AAGH65_05010 [Pseudomonadota bacterium]